MTIISIMARDIMSRPTTVTITRITTGITGRRRHPRPGITTRSPRRRGRTPCRDREPLTGPGQARRTGRRDRRRATREAGRQGQPREAPGREAGPAEGPDADGENKKKEALRSPFSFSSVTLVLAAVNFEKGEVKLDFLSILTVFSNLKSGVAVGRIPVISG